MVFVLPFHTDHEDTPNSFYSWVANSMTEKPPLDERYAKVIEVIERQMADTLWPQMLAKDNMQERGWDRC